MRRSTCERFPVPVPRSSSRERPDLTLHIGTGKTGTSSIQVFLQRNRNRLAQRGYLYPRSPGPRRHLGLRLFMSPAAFDELPERHQERLRSPQVLQRRLAREVERHASRRVLLSDESLFGSPERELQGLHQLTRDIGRELKILVYLRRQDDHVASRYQQVVKAGETRRMVERVQQLDLSRPYDYHARLCSWQQLMEPSEIVVRTFERGRFVDGSLYQDFLSAAGVDVQLEELEDVEPVNESLDAESVEFLRILNLLRLEHPSAAASLGRGNFGMTRPLARASTGPTLTLPASVLDAFMAQWHETNR